jgi:ATP-binding cassette subfamily B protein
VTERRPARVLLTRFLWPYRWHLAIGSAVTLTETAVDLARPWPLLLAVDYAIGRQPVHGPLAFLAPVQARGPLALAGVAATAMVLLATLSAVLGYLTDCLIGMGTERIGADLRAAAHARLLRLSLRFHDRQRSGDLVTRLTGDIARVEDALVAWMAILVPEILTLAGMLVVLCAIDPLMAAAGLAVIPFLVLLALVRRRVIQPAQRESREQQGLLASHLTEGLRHVRAVQAFAQEREALRRFAGLNRSATRTRLTALDLSARYAPVGDVVLAAGSGFVLWIGVLRVTSGRMTVGVLMVVLAYLANLYGPVRALTRMSVTMARRAASQERILEILGSAEVVAEDPRPQPLTGVEDAIGFDAVHFGYSAATPVLRGLSLRVPAASTIAIVGPTGAGKSTLLSLLLRLYDPDGGAITVDGTDLRRFGLASLRERIALVPQDPWIMDGTIRDNIAFGRPAASEGEVMAAARVALVDEFASRLPSGYDSAVGEGGGQLSGGQRRRLAIARALVRDAAILLLDEPTAGLDAEAEAEVLAAIRRAARGRTVVLVTHSLALAGTADRVAVIRDGIVVEEGPPADLLTRDQGEYHRLWAVQRPAVAVLKEVDHGAGRPTRRPVNSRGRR